MGVRSMRDSPFAVDALRGRYRGERLLVQALVTGAHSSCEGIDGPHRVPNGIWKKDGRKGRRVNE
jgi:hypothetical protein